MPPVHDYKTNKTPVFGSLSLPSSMKLLLLIIYFSFRPRFTSGGVEYLKQNGLNIQLPFPFHEGFYKHFFERINRNQQSLIKDRLKSIILKKSEIQIIKHENGYIQVRVPKSKLIDLIYVKQSNPKNCTCRGGSNDCDDEQEEQVLSDIEENKQRDFLDVEESDPKLSEIDGLLKDTLDKLVNFLNTSNNVLGSWDDFEEVKRIILNTVNSKSAGVNLQRKYKKGKFAVQTIGMIKDVMDSSSYENKYVPLSILLNHKLKYV